MPKGSKRYYRYYRRSRPSYVRDFRIVSSAAWADHPSHRDARVLSLQVVYNPENDRVNPGSVKTVKHLEVQVNTVPYWRHVVSTAGGGTATVTGVPPVGWVLVYVPQGSSPSFPLGTDATMQNSALYEPNQFVLGHGTLLQGERIMDDDAANADAYPPAVSAGNNMRIRCPLSKKLSPGDSIYLLVYAIHCPTDPELALTEFTGIVSYAMKDN